MSQLVKQDFARLFGCALTDVSPTCDDLIQSHDFTFEEISLRDQVSVLDDIAQHLALPLDRTSPQNIAKWERGWQENYDELIRSGNVEALRPHYDRRHQPVRLFQQFVWPTSPDFEWNFLKVYRQWLFEQYFRDVSHVYEFGCGPGHWLFDFAQKAPDKIYTGFDWATSSQKILTVLQQISPHLHLTGQHFDLYNPDLQIPLASNSVVFTCGAMEQTGRRYQRFLEYLLLVRPRFVIHCEPIVEWYHSGVPIDQAAIAFHRRRAYWEGGLPFLLEWERTHKIEIINARRILFGSLYLEGYSLVVWRPR